MRLATREQALELDRLSQLDVPAETLMENAGRFLAEYLSENYEHELSSSTCLIVCGRGNNGGDGLVAARYLVGLGYSQIRVVTFVGERSPLFHTNLAKLRGVTVSNIQLGQDLPVGDCGILVDAFFGVGLNRSMDDESLLVIQQINRFVGPVISVDLPSGLNSDTGWDWGSCVRASETITFGTAKPGLFMNVGYECAGEVVVADIGFPESIIEKICTTRSLIGEEEAAALLPRRHYLSNKTDHGRVAVIAGSRGMWGAGVLSSRAAYRAGAGYVYLLSHEDPSRVVNDSPEILVSSLDDFKAWESVDSFVVGPGLGVNEQTLEVIQRLIRGNKKRVLLDADALTVVANHRLYPLPKTWVITPHSGELSRLIGLTSEEIEFDRFRALDLARKMLGCIILLKGFRTLVTDGEAVHLIGSGNPALAKAGSGDVLSGLVGSLLAQGLQPEVAASLGAYLHGLAADLWVRDQGHPAALLTSELIQWLPKAWREIHPEEVM